MWELHLLQEERFGIDGKEVVHHQFICRNQVVAEAMKSKLECEGYSVTIRAFDPEPIDLRNMNKKILELKKWRI